MACDARQVLADGSGYSGFTTPQLKAVQLQIAAEALLAMEPSADVSFSAILERARVNGFCCLTRTQLRAVTLQLLCDISKVSPTPPEPPGDCLNLEGDGDPDAVLAPDIGGNNLTCENVEGAGDPT